MIPTEDWIQRVDAEGDCWLWTGGTNTHGYGQVQVKGRRWVTHRLMWETLVGPIEDGLELDHLCRVPACCNPDHLEPVTHRENMMRGKRNGYHRKTHCPQGHEYTRENTYRWKNYRYCRACHLVHGKKWRDGQ